MVDLGYDWLSRMIPINVTGPLNCCPEASPHKWTHHGDAVGVIVHVPSMVITNCGRPGRPRFPRRGDIENGYHRGAWRGRANVVHLRQGTAIGRCGVSACTAA